VTRARVSQSSRVAPLTFHVTKAAGGDGYRIQIHCPTPDIRIYYSTDGTEPTEEGLCYQEPLNLAEGTTLKAKAFKEGWLSSKTGVLKIGE